MGICVYMRYRRHSIDLPTKAFVGVAGTAFFLQLPLSAALWKWLPFLFLVQFPFRLLALLAGTLPLVLLSKTTPRWVLVGSYILLAALASIPFYRYRHQNEDFRPMASLLNDFETHGYLGAPEYTPIGVREPLRYADVAALENPDNDSSDCRAVLTLEGPREQSLKSWGTRLCNVRLPIFAHPYWQAIDDAGRSIRLERSANGLLVAAVPPGPHTVRLLFLADSEARRLSALMSVILTIVMVTYLLREKSRSESLQRRPVEDGSWDRMNKSSCLFSKYWIARTYPNRPIGNRHTVWRFMKHPLISGGAEGKSWKCLSVKGRVGNRPSNL